jgi:hypothetical protein
MLVAFRLSGLPALEGHLCRGQSARAFGGGCGCAAQRAASPALCSAQSGNIAVGSRTQSSFSNPR